MKVKSLLLSMCAIAALASCSQDDEVTPEVSNAEETKVYLQLKGDGVNTRANGDLEAGESTETDVANMTVFFFNSAGNIIGSPKYILKANLNDPIKTTTDAAQVAVIANLGTDETAGKFQSVKSLEQLKKVSFSSITAPATVNQSVTNVYMSGMGTIVPNGSDAFKADVTLHFITARIKTVTINWKADQKYGVHSTFAQEGDKDKYFTIKQVYLMKAQTNSYLLPADAVGYPSVVYTGSFVPTTIGWAGGVAWEAQGPWSPIPTPTPVVTTDYLVAKDFTADAAGGNGITNALEKSWYTFENNLADNPTGLIVEYVWRSKENSVQANELLTRYFTVYFGEKKENATQPLLEAGKSYNITLNLNGDFTPEGDGGGGTPDPSKPSTDAKVTVSITPAQWTTAEMSKDFQ